MYFIISVVIIVLVFVLMYYISNKDKESKVKKSSSLNKEKSTPNTLRLSTNKDIPDKIFTQETLNLYIKPKKPEELTKYYIPPSYFILNKNALTECSNLKDIYIHDDVKLIENTSFINCFSLININVDEDNKYYCSKLGSFFSKDYKEIISYPPAKQTSTYFIHEGVETINSFAFANSKFLKYVIVPNTVEIICENAFINCKSLKQIIIPDTVKDIHPRAFNICPILSIRGYKGSVAEDYCNKYYIPFEYLAN